MSAIQTFFEEKTIFMTGGTGYLGTALAEKILRCCPGVKRLYILVRDKKGLSADHRFNEWCRSIVLSNVAKNNPDAFKKVIFLQGNLHEAQLGLSNKAFGTLVEEVNCVFHVGAEVNFVKPLHDLLLNNLVGTNEMILLGKQIKNLEAFVYISTAFAQCNKTIVQEILYDSICNSENMLSLLRKLDIEQFNRMPLVELEGFPNNYTFTKCLAEDLIRRKADNLPVAVIRPTIVAPSLKEPVPGWTNHYQSYSQIVATVGLGLLHVFRTTHTDVMDIIPLDYTVNLIMASAWNLSIEPLEKRSIAVYNSATGHQNPLSIEQHIDLLDYFDKALPSNKKIWHRFVILSSSVITEKLLYFFHLPLMFLLDASNIVLRRPLTYLKLYKKTHFLVGINRYFTECTWLFRTDNTNKLWNKLSAEDKKIFNFDVSSIDWYLNVYTFTAGIRLYVLKEKPETVPKALIRRRVLEIVHYITVAVLLYIFWVVVKMFLGWCL